MSVGARGLEIFRSKVQFTAGGLGKTECRNPKDVLRALGFPEHEIMLLHASKP